MIADADFRTAVVDAARKNRSWICVGLDPDPARFPKGFSRTATGAAAFLSEIILSTNKHVCAYKPNIAFFERWGARGLKVLKDVIDRIPAHIPIILDAKRGDIGNTSANYAKAAFEHFMADAITVNPYLGLDSIEPFVRYRDKETFLLCLTSNQSAADFQKQMVLTESGEKLRLYQLVARKAFEWNRSFGNIGLVVGATNPAELSEIRQIVGEDMPILIPGVGAQGGDIEEALIAGANSRGEMAIINVSRSVLYASSKVDFAEMAARETRKLASTCARFLQTRNSSAV